MKRRFVNTFGLLGLLLVSGTAFAHEGHDHASLGSGFAHPFGGLDHLLAMVAVGLLGARYGKHWRWVLPLGFVAGLGVGGLLGASGVGLPAVEMSIAISVLLFGVMLSLGTKTPAAAAMAVVLLAGLPHGHAHLAETGGGALLGYGLGMVIGSALLHAGGLLAGLAIQKALPERRWQRVAGPAFALAGLVLTVGLMV